MPGNQEQPKSPESESWRLKLKKYEEADAALEAIMAEMLQVLDQADDPVKAERAVMREYAPKIVEARRRLDDALSDWLASLD